VLSKLLAATLIGLILGRLFFRAKLRELGTWANGVVNAFLIAIVIVYTIQLLFYLSSR